MIPRLVLTKTTKFNQSIFRCYFPRKSFHKTSKLPKSSASFSPHQESDIPNIANHRDWLSPKEVVKIFQSLKNPNHALNVFDQISHRKDYSPNESVYTAVIQKLAEANDFDAVEALMERIKAERKCRLSEDFFLAVLKVYGHSGGRINSAVRTLFDMPDFKCWPTVRCFNFVLNLLVNTKQFEVIHEVYLRAAQVGVEVDACSLNIVVKGLCKRGKFEAAFAVLDEFSELNLQPNVRTFSTLMHGLCDHSRVDDAFALLERMERDGIDPDAVTFNILISGLRKKGRFEEGIRLFDRMMIEGCDPNPGTYQEVLYCFLDAEKFVEANGFMCRMIEKDISPSYESYKLVIHGLCVGNLVREVDWALKEMVRQGFVPRMGMWKRILQCLFSDRNYCNVSFPVEEIVRN